MTVAIITAERETGSPAVAGGRSVTEYEQIKAAVKRVWLDGDRHLSLWLLPCRSELYTWEDRLRCPENWVGKYPQVQIGPDTEPGVVPRRFRFQLMDGIPIQLVFENGCNVKLGSDGEFTVCYFGHCTIVSTSTRPHEAIVVPHQLVDYIHLSLGDDRPG